MHSIILCFIRFTCYMHSIRGESKHNTFFHKNMENKTNCSSFKSYFFNIRKRLK
ncbi:hypothetical protein HanIR_Chr13g0655121 [Helianthus annuus]|nr:hypothetical protein HanIR_Chr13g0655121 [Helianthus annuus]